ncbi:MAG: threonine--tRNA ligase [Armatimonadota bacterium]|nr:threonine--tRNA ligase [Armatimonadota bacterium]MDR7534013.1 threonine--tRNA ligase [Armatimonadota bacterium]MDR7536544.1 threonine--tRNA ligase [Armatimonadota bacterium]
MPRIRVQLADGSTYEVETGTTAGALARRLGLRDAIAVLVNGRARDLAAPLDDGARVQFLTFEDPAGREIFWHSTAHLLAQAVKQLFPQAKLAIGPPIDDGFYYDFDIGRPFSPEDLERIEARMRELAAADQPIERLELPRQDAQRRLEQDGEVYKLELLAEIPDAHVSFYRQDGFQDMCRGPHLPRTGLIGAVKLLSTSGAYWRGDERRPMLQRIYGVSYPTAERLDAHLQRLEEARRRDHRRIGRELQLFHIAPEVGPGLPLWLPKGATIRRIVERYIVDLELAAGYQHVYSQELASSTLYKISGHWDHYRDNMYPPMQVDAEELVLRPMNCPHHIMIYRVGQRSYRDLPVRIAELGRVYRYERSGVLAGLARVRGMTMNDAHIFLRPDQIKDEIAAVVRLIQRVYADFRISGAWYQLSLRDPADREKFIQNDALWDQAERMLREALGELGIPYREAMGEAAFYGPKIDVQVPTAAGKDETISTVQLDFLLPERFALEYIGEDGRAHRPVLIHRAITSTMERWVAMLIEQYEGKFPLWLAPEQVRVLPIADRHHDYARAVGDRLAAEGLRVAVDASNERISYKVRQAQLEHVPYMAVVGDREQAAGTVAVRSRSAGDLGPMPVEQFLARLRDEVAARA